MATVVLIICLAGLTDCQWYNVGVVPAEECPARADAVLRQTAETYEGLGRMFQVRCYLNGESA